MSEAIKRDQEASVPEDDVLERILVVARAEGALGAESMGAFAKALRERARLVLAERVRPVEERLAAIEKENDWRARLVGAFQEETRWRREVMAALEEETRWRREAMAALEEETRWRREAMAALEEETRWRREAMAGLEKENAWRAGALATLEQESARLGEQAEALRAERERAAAAHDRLLEHHRKVVAEVVEALGRIPGLLPWRFRRVRAAVGELVRLLWKELG